MAEWSEAFNTGHEEIDSHHREIFKLDSLLDAVIRSHSWDSIANIVSYIQDYIVTHFLEEEQLMQEHNYGDYVFHKAQHEYLSEKVLEIVGLFDQKNSMAHCMFKIRAFIDLLIMHIRKVDIHIRGLGK